MTEYSWVMPKRTFKGTATIEFIGRGKFMTDKSNSIFVFGSNLGGKHGAGSAKAAAREHGAQYGVGEGPTGNAYAIPTKDININTLSLDSIKIGIDRFIRYAKEKPYLEFNIVAIGCGLAGYKATDIAPMFKDAPSNCKFLDDDFNKILKRKPSLIV